MDFAELGRALEFDPQSLEFNLSLDCVLFSIFEGELRILVNKPFPGADWMLPGGFMQKNEDADTAAGRILFQRTGVENIFLQQFRVFSEPGRFSFKQIFENLAIDNFPLDIAQLPERVISIGFFALVNKESLNLTGGVLGEENAWLAIEELPPLAFDHNQIATEALEALRREVHFRPITHKLLPEKFTMPELQRLYEIILDKGLDRGSFQRKMLKWDIFERLEERKEGVAHKRPFFYRFDKKKYELAREKGIKFGM